MAPPQLVGEHPLCMHCLFLWFTLCPDFPSFIWIVGVRESPLPACFLLINDVYNDPILT